MVTESHYLSLYTVTQLVVRGCPPNGRIGSGTRVRLNLVLHTCICFRAQHASDRVQSGEDFQLEPFLLL